MKNADTGDSSEEGTLGWKERWRVWDVMREMETGPARLKLSMKKQRCLFTRQRLCPRRCQDALQKGSLPQMGSHSVEQGLKSRQFCTKKSAASYLSRFRR